MKISVIIPSYKPQDYLWQCLNSLASQTLSKEEFEIILVLNGCNEPFNSDIKKYINNHQDLQFNFIQTNQGGVSNARNLALNEAIGEYITFIDDDDYVSPSYLEELYAKSALDTIALCYPYAFKDGNPEKQLPYRITNAYNSLSRFGKQPYLKSRKFFSGPCMKLIPRHMVENRRFDINFKNGEDALYMFLISDHFKYVDYTSTKAIYYRRIRVGSASCKKSIAYKFCNSIRLMKVVSCGLKVLTEQPLMLQPHRGVALPTK